MLDSWNMQENRKIIFFYFDDMENEERKKYFINFF